MTESELELYRRAAKAAGKDRSTWVRDALREAVEKQFGSDEIPAECDHLCIGYTEGLLCSFCPELPGVLEEGIDPQLRPRYQAAAERLKIALKP